MGGIELYQFVNESFYCQPNIYTLNTAIPLTTPVNMSIQWSPMSHAGTMGPFHWPLLVGAGLRTWPNPWQLVKIEAERKKLVLLDVAGPHTRESWVLWVGIFYLAPTKQRIHSSKMERRMLQIFRVCK